MSSEKSSRGELHENPRQVDPFRLVSDSLHRLLLLNSSSKVFRVEICVNAVQHQEPMPCGRSRACCARKSAHAFVDVKCRAQDHSGCQNE